MSYNGCWPPVFSWRFLFLAVNAILQPCVLLGPKFLRQNDYRLRQSVRWVIACKDVIRYYAVQSKSSQFCDQIWSVIVVLNKYLVFYLRFIVSCVDNWRQFDTNVMHCKVLARAFTKTKAYQQVSIIQLQLMYFIWLFVVYSALRGKTNYFPKFFIQQLISRCTVRMWKLSSKPAGRGFDSLWCHWNFSVT